MSWLATIVVELSSIWKLFQEECCDRYCNFQICLGRSRRNLQIYRFSSIYRLNSEILTIFELSESPISERWNSFFLVWNRLKIQFHWWINMDSNIFVCDYIQYRAGIGDFSPLSFTYCKYHRSQKPKYRLLLDNLFKHLPSSLIDQLSMLLFVLKKQDYFVLIYSTNIPWVRVLLRLEIITW